MMLWQITSSLPQPPDAGLYPYPSTSIDAPIPQPTQPALPLPPQPGLPPLPSPPPARDATHAANYIGLQFDVPWSIWGGGYDGSTQVIVGTVTQYKSGVFKLTFSLSENTAPEYIFAGTICSASSHGAGSPCAREPSGMWILQHRRVQARLMELASPWVRGISTLQYCNVSYT